MKTLLRLCPALLLLAAISCQGGAGTIRPGSHKVSLCEVHHRPLEQKKVPILYGMPPPPGKSDPTRDQASKLFPYRTRGVEGGCMVRSAKTTTIPVCTDCDAAYAKWQAKHH